MRVFFCALKLQKSFLNWHRLLQGTLVPRILGTAEEVLGNLFRFSLFREAILFVVLSLEV